jgi:hypothetical protein
MANPFRFVDPGPFLHWVNLGRAAASGGTTNPATGKYVPGGARVALVTADLAAEPNADVQDQRRTIERDLTGTPTVQAEATIFLRDETVVRLIEEGDTGDVVGEEFGAEPLDFEVVGTQLLDGAVFVRWVR